MTEAKLRDLQPGERAYQISDGGDALFVVVLPSGSRSFRYDYRLGGQRETLTTVCHQPVARHAQRSHLAHGMDVTLEEMPLRLARARADLSSGRSPVSPSYPCSLNRTQLLRLAFGMPSTLAVIPTDWPVLTSLTDSSLNSYVY